MDLSAHTRAFNRRGEMDITGLVRDLIGVLGKNGEGLDQQFGAEFSQQFEVRFTHRQKPQADSAFGILPHDFNLGLQFFAFPVKVQIALLTGSRKIFAFTPAALDTQRMKGYLRSMVIS